MLTEQLTNCRGEIVQLREEISFLQVITKICASLLWQRNKTWKIL